MKRLENINGNIFEPVFNNGKDAEMMTYLHTDGTHEHQIQVCILGPWILRPIFLSNSTLLNLSLLTLVTFHWFSLLLNSLSTTSALLCFPGSRLGIDSFVVHIRPTPEFYSLLWLSFSIYLTFPFLSLCFYHQFSNHHYFLFCSLCSWEFIWNLFSDKLAVL